MIHEKSAGIIPFDPKSKKFLILHYPLGHWGFPKGHVEENETEMEAAKREMKEETGIEVEVLFGFKSEISYFYKNKGKLSHKKVIFFIGITKSNKVKLSFEHDDFKWATAKEAMETLTFKNEKEVLKRAIEFLKATGYSIE